MAAQPITSKVLKLRTPTGVPLRLEAQRAVALAARWAYRVRNRRRWEDEEAVQKELQRLAKEDLAELGVDNKGLQRLAEAGIVEVSFEAPADSSMLAALLPWEFLVSAATRPLRGMRNLLVTRHLRCGRSRRRPKPRRALLVLSAPGELAKSFSFETKSRFLESHLRVGTQSPKEQVPKLEVNVLITPTVENLRTKIATFGPDLIHLSGFDAHQGSALLTQASLQHKYKGGFYLLGQDGSPEMIRGQALGKILTANKESSPSLVTADSHNSAAMLGTAVVSLGARHAIGFQDEIDETLAEVFFARFFRAWRLSGFDTPRAFELAFHEIECGKARIRGSGIVLWSDTSLVLARRRKAQIPTLPEGDPVLQTLRKARREEARLPSTGDGGLREVLLIDPRPHKELNYSLLHNDRDLFSSFRYHKMVDGVLSGVEVKVVMFVGSDTFPYQSSMDFDKETDDIARRIRVPLTWEFVRSIRESIRTTLFISVRYANQLIYQDTHSVVLLPIEEWRDNQRDGIWLPSFVLPRDPAINSIVRRAQRYLMALCDDSGDGFDGYQVFTSGHPDPWERIDLQARALWSALVYDHDLVYIEPPPTYTTMSQRLRSPTDVLEGGHGTCIDLALTFAACLEYIGIYPVIFLLKGHAFPGYWRDPNGHSEWLQPTAPEIGDLDSAASRDIEQTGQEYPWMLEAQAYDELLQLILDESLVPLETVKLTSKGSFVVAVEEALEKLRDRKEFDGLLDIMKARKAGVTPLPLRGALR